MTYLVKEFHKETGRHNNLRYLFNEKGWSCFPFHVVSTGDLDPQGNPICTIPNAPNCGTASLYFFEYEQIR